MKTGFLPLLGILFIGLKLGKVITWSWLWVLSPLWGAAIIWLTCLIIYVVTELNKRQRNTIEINKKLKR